MSKKLPRWTLDKLAKTITACLLNLFDFFCVIEGGTGTGKSTLAILLARKVRKEFKKLFEFDEETIQYYYTHYRERHGETLEQFINIIQELKDKDVYKFRLHKEMIYSQKEMLKALSSWHRIFIPDEMINIAFNRDFQSENQKNIIKMVNMYRDHRNLILPCVPYFQTLDNQIKNLTKMRLSIVRRGIAIVQTPNRILHGRDKWDQQVNEKIEREWLMKGIKNPNYAKLSTTRGILKFPKLPEKLEKIYQEIKNAKRAKIAEEEMGIKKEEEALKDPVSLTIQALIDGKIKNGNSLDGIALVNGFTPSNFKSKIVLKLEKMGKVRQLSHYYWDKKFKETAENLGSLKN